MKRFVRNAKKKIEIIFENKIDRMLQKSITFLINEMYLKAAQNDKKILSLLKIISLFRGVNVQLSDLVKYVRTLDSVALYQRDTMVDNESSLLFSKDLVNNGITTRIFNEKDFVKYINAVIILNMRLGRMDTYRKIYDMYIKNYSIEDKTYIIRYLLGYYCGDIDYNTEVVPLLGKFHTYVRKKERLISAESKTKKKNLLIKELTQYITNTVIIADAVFYEIDDIEFYISREIRKYKGRITRPIVALIEVILRKDRCIEEVKEWLISVNDSKDDGILRIRSILNEIETGELQPKIENSSKGDPYKQLLIALENKKSNKKELFELCRKTEQKYIKMIKASKDVSEKIKHLNLLFKVRYKLQIQKFWNEYNDSLSQISSVSHSDIVYFFPSDWNVVTGAYSLPILMEAKKRGYFCVPSNPTIFDFVNCDDMELNEISGSRYYNTYTDKIDSLRRRYKWKIDIDNKKIETMGLNVYEPIYESISRWQFSFFFNYDTNAWARARINYYINAYEKVFYQCEKLEKWAIKNSKKVRIISTFPFLHIYAGYRIYCEEKGFKCGMEYICVRNGYDDYFLNSHGTKNRRTLTAINLSKNQNARTSIYGTKKGFMNFYDENIMRFEDIREKVTKYFDFQRSKNYITNNEKDEKKRKEILSIIDENKNCGKKVYCLNGKIIFDLAVKYTKGCVHNDMSHWATHTVDIINDNPDILLLIKPHPLESDKSITMTEESIATFRDIIASDFRDNIIYLNDHLFRNVDLAPYIDLALVWNGTSALEFAALGVKVIMGDTFGYYDYPIGFSKPESIDEYTEILNNVDCFKNNDDLTKRAIMFLAYMGSNDINITNKYTQVTTSNYNVFKTKIIEEAIENYIANGDKELERLFDRIDQQ